MHLYTIAQATRRYKCEIQPWGQNKEMKLRYECGVIHLQIQILDLISHYATVVLH